MGKEYVIKDGLVYSKEAQQVNGRTVITEQPPVHLDTFVNQLATRANHRVFFPPLSFGHVIAEAKQNRSEMYIIQQNPSVVKITEQLDDQQRPHERKIGVPYVYFAVRLHQGAFSYMKVYFRRQQVESENDPLGCCCLPNQNTNDNRVCISRSLSEELQGHNEPSEILDTVINSFWKSPFNTDWSTHWDTARRRIRGFPQSFAEWQSLTVDPQRQRQVLTWEWMPANTTIGALLSEVRRA